MTQTPTAALTPFSALTVAPPAHVAPEWHMGALMLWHVTSADSGGLVTLGEAVVRRGLEPPMHVHAREDETWYVIDGAVVFQRGHERIRAMAGDSVFLPRGLPHGFAVESPTARLLHMYTPGGLDAAFRALSAAASAAELPPPPPGPPDASVLRQVEETFGRHGVTFVGPPLSVVLATELVHEMTGAVV